MGGRDPSRLLPPWTPVACAKSACSDGSRWCARLGRCGFSVRIAEVWGGGGHLVRATTRRVFFRLQGAMYQKDLAGYDLARTPSSYLINAAGRIVYSKSPSSVMPRRKARGPRVFSNRGALVPSMRDAMAAGGAESCRHSADAPERHSLLAARPAPNTSFTASFWSSASRPSCGGSSQRVETRIRIRITT